MKKKILSLLLAFSVLATALLPGSLVLAEDVPSSTPVDDENNGLHLSSAVTPNEDGSYHVNLESYVTAAHKPLDVVLVLDTTENMSESLGNTSRIEAMKQASLNLIDQLDKAYAKGYEHRVGIVHYFDESYVLTKNNESGALFDVKSKRAEIEKIINNLQPDNGGFDDSKSRNIQQAMKNTNQLLEENCKKDKNDQKYDEERQQVVIVLTSGNPKSDSYDFDSGWANISIQQSLEMKQKGAFVYSVGIFDESDPSQLYGESGFNDDSDGTVGSHWCKFEWPSEHYVRDIPANNRFLNYISSNSDNAEHLGIKSIGPDRLAWEEDYHIYPGWRITSNFNCDTDAGFYQSAKDPEALKNVFADIIDRTLESHVQLDDSSVLKEQVAPYFSIVESSVECSTVKSTGNLEFDENSKTSAGESVVATVDGNNLSVTGFDYNINCVTPEKKGDGTFGNKLVVEFDVKLRPDFIGGNGVKVCGGAGTGIYQNGTTKVGDFGERTVDLPICCYNYKTLDQTVKYGENVDLTKSILMTEKVDGTNNAYVDIEYTLKKGETVVGTYEIKSGQTSGTWTWTDGSDGKPVLTETTKYNVECKISPVNLGTYKEQTINSKFTVTVLLFELTIQETGGKPDETYVYNIKKDGKPFITVKVDGESQVTITQLEAGVYTVEQETAWSWRYDPNESKTITIDGNNAKATIAFHDTVSNTKWLNDYAQFHFEGGAQ